MTPLGVHVDQKIFVFSGLSPVSYARHTDSSKPKRSMIKCYQQHAKHYQRPFSNKQDITVLFVKGFRTLIMFYRICRYLKTRYMICLT